MTSLIQCTSPIQAQVLALVLEHEGYPSAWFNRGKRGCHVATFAPTTLVNACVAVLPGSRATLAEVTPW